MHDISGVPGTGGHTGNGIVIGQANRVLMERNEVHHTGWLNDNCGGPAGIWAWDSNLVNIQFNEAHHVSDGTGCDGDGFDFDGSTTNSIMQYNYAHDNDGAGFLVWQFDTAHRPIHNITLRYNISYNDNRDHKYAALTIGGGMRDVANGIDGVEAVRDSRCLVGVMASG